MNAPSPSPDAGRVRFRKLRIAWSVVCGVACVALIALWVRSYYQPRIAIAWRGHSVDVAGGKLFFGESWTLSTQGDSTWRSESNTPFAVWSYVPAGRGIRVPIWLFLVVIVLAAAIPWIKWRFGLRTLLIATTLVAVTLGAIVYAVK